MHLYFMDHSVHVNEILLILILYLPTYHLGAKSSFKREREIGYK